MAQQSVLEMEREARVMQEQRRRIAEAAEQAAGLRAEIEDREDRLCDQRAQSILYGRAEPADRGLEALRKKLAALEAVIPRVRPQMARSESELMEKIVAGLRAYAERVKANAVNREAAACARIEEALHEFVQTVGSAKALDFLLRHTEDMRRSPVHRDPYIRESERAEAALLDACENPIPAKLLACYRDLLEG